VKVKDIASYAVIAFIVWWVILQPHNAAQIVHNIGNFLSTTAAGLSHFAASI
jgi:hypothetical protein